MLAFKRILAPIDFSDYSQVAAQTAAEIASKFGADLILFHAMPAVSDLPAVEIFKEGEHRAELREEAEQRLQTLAERLSAENIRVETEIGEANEAGMEILRAAEANRADLIVIATHGMTGWRAVAFGSVAEKVAEQAKCPVLILRAQAEQQEQKPPRASEAAA